MPVYGQSTELNERLSSLMSCIFSNSNNLYDGVDRSTKLSATPPRLKNRRPLFTEAIIQKASRLEEIRWKPESLQAGVVPETTTVLEIILVANQAESAKCNLLANLVSHLFAMPEEHTSNLVLEVTPVRSNAIREDLAIACSSRSLDTSDAWGRKQRRRVFVGLGSAVQGLCLYLHQEEVTCLRMRETTSTVKSESSGFSTISILAVVCIDPPSHLWNSCGRSILEQTSLKGIPSFFVSYTEKDEGTGEQISKALGQLLNDCKRYPHSLALVANESANILRQPGSSDSKNGKLDFDACVWTAKLVTKYAESIQRIRTPPMWPLSDESIASKL